MFEEKKRGERESSIRTKSSNFLFIRRHTFSVFRLFHYYLIIQKFALQFLKLSIKRFKALGIEYKYNK